MFSGPTRLRAAQEGESPHTGSNIDFPRGEGRTDGAFPVIVHELAHLRGAMSPIMSHSTGPESFRIILTLPYYN
jgi:hypothetical protein